MSLKFTKDHEWVRPEADAALVTVGITVHAQDALGDVVFVDLPEVGTHFDQGQVAGVVESVKAAADVFMPVSGEIAEVNEALRADPSLANSAPLEAGWFFKVRLSAPAQLDELLDGAAYEAFSASN
jgi:glycine cleavage system H protein